MENSYRFFKNTACKYFPCHAASAFPAAVGTDDFNCLFCFCPLYLDEHCGGKPSFITNKSGRIKDCSNCTLPHVPKGYDYILEKLAQVRFSATGEPHASS